MVVVTDRLDRYWAEELGCTPEDLYTGGITICSPPHREMPRWMGWLVPFEVIALDKAEPGAGVVSITPSLAGAFKEFLDEQKSPEGSIPPNAMTLYRFCQSGLPNTTPKVHRITRCNLSDFIPAPEIFPISELSTSDLYASWYRLHFDGPVFVARNERGTVVSWAAIKCKSDDVWEMAVVTEPLYQGRGLARSVVSRATQTALDAGKQPMYLHEVSNYASAHVCASLGYQPYGYEFTCESGRVVPTRRG